MRNISEGVRTFSTRPHLILAVTVASVTASTEMNGVIVNISSLHSTWNGNESDSKRVWYQVI